MAKRSKPTAGTDRRPVRKWLANHLAEMIVYGGLIATRGEAQEDAMERMDSRLTGPARMTAASAFGFGPRVKVATPEEVATLPRLYAVRAAEAAGLPCDLWRMTPAGLTANGVLLERVACALSHDALRRAVMPPEPAKPRRKERT